MRCNLCQSKKTIKKLTIKTRDRFEIASKVNGKNYTRFWYKCNNCLVLFNVQKLVNKKKLQKISKNYFKIDFPNLTPEKRFKNIINLANKDSDNYYRVKRVAKFLSKTRKHSKLLDFGAGLGIFLFKLIKLKFKNHNKWNFFSFEPDISNKKLIKKNIFIKNIDKNIFKKKNYYDFITLNKVLEHIEKPIELLTRLRSILKDGAVIYIEVPHISGALKKNDSSLVSLHYNIFSKASLEFISFKLNFNILDLKIISEPSKKKTIYAFMKVNKNVR